MMAVMAAQSAMMAVMAAQIIELPSHLYLKLIDIYL